MQYGDRILLDEVGLVVNDRDKLGLVGRNGAGKSTFLKILAGHISPQKGNVSFPKDRTLAFLHQDIDIPLGKTIHQIAASAFEEVMELQRKSEEFHREMEERTDYESDSYAELIQRFTEIGERLETLGASTMEADIEKVLKGLGFRSDDFQRLVDEFSGGWQMRAELARMLLQKPDYLLLDEPPNHLDIESILWLEEFLRNHTGSVIIISHDKEFLDRTTDRTVEVELGKLYDYKAPYKKYVALKAERMEKQRSAYENQQRLIAQKERTINRFMAKATKTKMAQSMQKQLDKMERVEIEETDNQAMNIQFPPSPRAGQVVIKAQRLSKSYGKLQVLKEVDFQLERGERVAFVGQNGQGKTTLAKMLVNQLPPSSGNLEFGHNLQVGYYAQNQADSLQPKLTLLETMEMHSPPEMRTKLRAILGAFLFTQEDQDKKVSVLSGGERARLALACLLLKPFNLLVLDEPTNHLDMISKDVLKQALQDYDGAMIVVSHDREFLSGLTDRTLEFRNRRLYNHLGDVNYFLEQRQMDNMREVEKSTPAVAEAEKPKRELSFEERKQLLRQVSNAEKSVERLEAKVAEIEQKMSDPAFFSLPDQDHWIDTYKDVKSQLEEAMEAWEQAQVGLEEAGLN
jgi:ATP-binding cassette subfamily F protein 3